MSLNKLIKTDKDCFYSPNIYSLHSGSLVDVFFEKFENNNQPIELVLFYSFNNKLYFPIWFEFRSINNNLLYYLEELKVKKFSLLAKILNASLEKEETYSTHFKALVLKTETTPHFCIEIDNFIIEETYLIECQSEVLKQS